MMPVAFPTNLCKSRCFEAESGALQKDLQSKNRDCAAKAARAIQLFESKVDVVREIHCPSVGEGRKHIRE